MLCRMPCWRCDGRPYRDACDAKDCRQTEQELRLSAAREVTVCCLNCGWESDPIKDIGTASVYALACLDYAVASS